MRLGFQGGAAQEGNFRSWRGSSSTITLHFPKVMTAQAAFSAFWGQVVPLSTYTELSFLAFPGYSIIHLYQELDGCAFLMSLQILKLMCCDS